MRDSSLEFSYTDSNETDRVYFFVTGDVASTDFETYGFYSENGHMKNVDFYPPVPFVGALGMAGMFDDGIWFPEAVTSHMFWNSDGTYERTMREVAARTCLRM